MQYHNKRSTRLLALWRGVLTVIVGLTVLRVWVGGPAVVETARAQLPDPAMQRVTLLKEARQTNQLLSEIKAILEQGTLNVRVAGADN